jgi:hypothetical protein
MKKSFLAALLLVLVNMAGFAQTTPKKAVTPVVVTPAKPAAPVKADGSLDMRYKANKEAAKTAPKLKKDGTPDKRYSRNKKK